LVFGFFGSVYGENRLRYRKPNFLDTKTETEPNYQKNRNFGSVRYGSVRFSVYGKNVPTPTLASPDAGRAQQLARERVGDPPIGSTIYSCHHFVLSRGARETEQVSGRERPYTCREGCGRLPLFRVHYSYIPMCQRARTLTGHQVPNPNPCKSAPMY
jgi:hypothetical protein